MRILGMAIAAVMFGFVPASIGASYAGSLSPGGYDFVDNRSVARITVSGVPGKARAEMPFTGTVTVGPDGSIATTRALLDARAISAPNQTALRQMRGPKGFDVDRHPSAEFNSTRVVQRGDALEVDGMLTIKGVTKPVTFSGRIVRSNARRIQASLEGTIDRTGFGVTAGRPLYGREAQVRLNFVARVPRR